MNRPFFPLLTIIFVFIAGNLSMVCDSYAQVAKVDMDRRTEELKNLRFGMFICWSFSTFSGYEWTPGVEDISFFNPTGFDPDQWCRTMKEANMGYVLFLTKHHDGFCLWDTKTTDRKVTNSPLGIDVLAEVKKSCDKYGIKIALYFSEGDWSWSGRKDIHTSVARPDIKKAQLKELLTEYGPIEFIWFDHAVGDGGLSHKETTEFIKSFQPGCFVGFNHGSPAGDLRIGERGKPSALDDVSGAGFNQGHTEEYRAYCLAEFTYPILEGQSQKKLRGAQWFYSLPENDNIAASAEKIYRDYLGAAKYGNIFSLDVGPDRSGKLRDIDVRTLQKVGQYIRGEAKLPPEPVSKNKPCKASSVWSEEFKPECAFDDDPVTRWGAAEDSRSGWIEVDLQQPTVVSRAVIDEGNWDRILRFELQIQKNDRWIAVAEGQKIGMLDLTFEPVTARYVRLNILEANEVPTILSFDLYPPDENESKLAKPTPQQLAWHEMEIQMFACLDPCTWQNREYDDHSTPLSKINPEKLDTDQWCKVAQSFGAKQILFVAKHTGGFCWWQTDTTDYSIKNTSYKNGKGDVLAELSESCKKYGLKLAIYVYPGDDTWGSPIGSGGKTRDPEKQEGYNKVFRQQMTEVLSKYGDISEVWFDGSCVIEVGDILKKYAPDSVIFQGPYTSLRWVGNEKGTGPDPNWNTVKIKDAKSGVATAVHGDPDGEVWLPNEVDTTLLDHKWFWGENTDQMIKSIDHLMDIYYKSVGRGCVLLLNSTPDTTGLIPQSHVKRYSEFGAEIKRRFDKPIAETKGSGEIVILSFDKATVINHTISMEDIKHGQRVREYIIEGFTNGSWQKLFEGTSIGYKKIDHFNSVEITKLRLKITNSAARPLIKRFGAFNVTSSKQDIESASQDWKQVCTLNKTNVANKWTEISIDLTQYIRTAGQYDLWFKKTAGQGILEIKSVDLLLEGMPAPSFITRNKNHFIINRTAAVENDKGKTEVKAIIKITDNCTGQLLIKQHNID